MRLYNAFPLAQIDDISLAAMTRVDRKDVAKTTIPKSQSFLGLTVAFTKNGDLKSGKFGIYQIQANGTYKPIG